MKRLTRQRWTAALLLAAVFVTLAGLVVWTRNDTPVARGYLAACATYALLHTAMLHWRDGFYGALAQGALAGAVMPLLMHIFYGSAPLVSAASLQGLAIWFVALLVAELLHLALRAVLVRPGAVTR